MKLLRETTFDVGSNVEFLEEGEKKVKNYFLSGVFMQTECVNRNKRMYPKGVVEGALAHYHESISKKRASALGELGHPDTPTINMPLASHLITDLHFEGNDIIGKAKILPYTTNGRIVQGFIDDGIVLGMSSRGLGSIEESNGQNVVQNDYKLATVDIVAEPSAPSAFVDGILEGKEWMIVDGVLTEMQLDRMHKETKKLKAEDVEKVALLVFENFLGKLRL